MHDTLAKTAEIIIEDSTDGILPAPRPAVLPVKGKGGRPKGSLGPSAAARRICRRMVDKTYLSRLRERMLAGTLSPAVECAVLAYAWGGKPTAQARVESTQETTVTVVKSW